MDWQDATFFDRAIYALWLDPEDVRARYDLENLAIEQRPLNSAFVEGWRDIAPGSNATVIEFTFRAAGNPKRKLLRRLNDMRVAKFRGDVSCRTSISLDRLDDYTLAYAIVARECGCCLTDWRFVANPLHD